MKYLFYSLIIIMMASCNTTKKNHNSQNSDKNNNTNTFVGMPGPHAIIYKTKADYSNLVPISMNSEKTEIVSYPDPKDVFYNGELALPTKLADGYLLDNRGLHPNSVFLDITYEEYSKLKKAPSLDEIKGMIKDKFPFTEMYDCGLRNNYKDEVKDLNNLINSGRLSEYKSLLFK